MTVTRRYHPLHGQQLAVVSGSRKQVVVRLADGTAMRMPRSWTDADGPPAPGATEDVFTVEALQELVELVEVIGRRGT